MPPHNCGKAYFFFPLLIAHSYGTTLEKSTYLFLGVASVLFHLCYTLLDKHDYFIFLYKLFQGVL